MSRLSRLAFIPPQLPSLTDQPPEGADWMHEVKHDGYRTMLVIERGTARTYTRNGHDWGDRLAHSRRCHRYRAQPAPMPKRNDARPVGFGRAGPFAGILMSDEPKEDTPQYDAAQMEADAEQWRRAYLQRLEYASESHADETPVGSFRVD